MGWAVFPSRCLTWGQGGGNEDNGDLLQKVLCTAQSKGKTTRPFRFDLNQIPYHYTMEVGFNRFKGLDLIDSAWRTMDGGSWHCTEGSDQDHPQEKEMQKGKMLVWGGLINSWEKKWKAKEKRKDIPIWMQSSNE